MKAFEAVFLFVSSLGDDLTHYASPGESETWCGLIIDGDASWSDSHADGGLCDSCWQIRQNQGGDGE